MRLNISHNYTTGSDEDVSETSDFLQPFSALLKRPMSNRPILAKRPILKTSDFLQQAPGDKSMLILEAAMRVVGIAFRFTEGHR